MRGIGRGRLSRRAFYRSHVVGDRKKPPSVLECGVFLLLLRAHGSSMQVATVTSVLLKLLCPTRVQLQSLYPSPDRGITA